MSKFTGWESRLLEAVELIDEVNDDMIRIVHKGSTIEMMSDLSCIVGRLLSSKENIETALSTLEKKVEMYQLDNETSIYPYQTQY